MQDIRSLLISGCTYHDIIEQLHLEPRTFYRYLNAVFEDDRRLLAENISDEETLNQMAICRDRLLAQRLDLLEMIKDPEVENNVKISAHHLAAEIAAAILKFYTEGPGILAGRHQFPRTSLTGPGTTGLS
jgi:hypothetical protein